MTEQIEHRHKAGTIRAKGQTLNGILTGYWEWFRKDGTKLRSGYFQNGEQVGQWITYDKQGNPHKITSMKPR